ncbi:MAG: hypothetical protein ACFB8W_05100 [Elainellaceae cyanobacterium]
MVSAQTDEMVAQLVSVDAQLAAHEAQLTAQIQAVQEKRQSLRSVIQTFSELSSPVAAAQEKVQTPAFLKARPESSDEPEMSRAVQETATSEPFADFPADAQVKEDPEAQDQTELTQAEPARSSATDFEEDPEPAAAPAEQTDGELPWQSYIRKDYRDLSLPKAVLKVLQQRPEGIVSVPEIIDTITIKSVPQSALTTIRTRLSNALSVGLKNQKWYRGKTGQYSLSKEAAVSDAAS